MTKKKNDNDWNVHGRGTHCPSSQPALMGWELQVCASFGTVAAGGCAEGAGWLHRLHDTVFLPSPHCRDTPLAACSKFTRMPHMSSVFSGRRR